MQLQGDLDQHLPILVFISVWVERWGWTSWASYSRNLHDPPKTVKLCALFLGEGAGVSVICKWVLDSQWLRILTQQDDF